MPPAGSGSAAGGPGGLAYGSGLGILNVLQGGSGGALGAYPGTYNSGAGGGGGGAIELGAVGSISISGGVEVNGEFAPLSAPFGAGGGGGGAILIAAPSVLLTGTLSAWGGAGGPGYLLNAGAVVDDYAPGGGGSGGVIAIDVPTTGGTYLDQGGTIFLNGGGGGLGVINNNGGAPTYYYGDSGAEGVLYISILPEPSGLLLAALGLLGAVGYGRHVRRRRP